MRMAPYVIATLLLSTVVLPADSRGKDRCKRIDFRAKSVKLYGAVHHYAYAPGAISNFSREYGVVQSEKPSSTYTISIDEMELCATGSGLRSKDNIMQVQLVPINEEQARQLERMSRGDFGNIFVITDGPMMKTGNQLAPLVVVIRSIQARDELSEQSEKAKTVDPNPRQRKRTGI